MRRLNQLSKFSRIFDWISRIFDWLASNWNVSHLIDLDVAFYMQLIWQFEMRRLNRALESWPFLVMNILKISFQYRTYTAKETPFRSEIMRYNDLEQTNTLFLRENRNQNASNSANAICLHVAWIRTDGCSRISILFSVILNSLLRILFHVFYSSHSVIRLTMCGFARS